MKKRNLALIGVAALLTAAAGLMRTAKAEQHRTQLAHDVVVLQAQQFYWHSGEGNNVTSLQWGGMTVYNSDSSALAPKIYLPVSTNGILQQVTTNLLAETMATLMDQGFDLKTTTADGSYILVRVR